MAQGQPGGGVGDSAAMKGLDEAIEGVRRASSDQLVPAMKKYREELAKEFEQVKRSKGEVAKFSSVLDKLKTNSKDLAATFDHVAEQAAREQGLLTRSMQVEYEEKRKFIQASIDDIKKRSGDNQAYLGAMAAEGRKLEEENMNQRLNTTIAYGKASNTLSGMGVSMVGTIQRHARTAATVAGDALGLTGSQMASIAGYGALAAGVLAVLGAMLQTTARNAKMATESGLEFSDGMSSLAGRYMTAVRQATTIGGVVQVLDQGKFSATWAQMRQEFLYDVGTTTEAYANLRAMTSAQRTEARLGAAGYLAEAIIIGQAYGIQQDEAAKLSVTMGRLSYASTRDQKKAMTEVNKQFMVMAEYANAAGIPVQMLIGSMGGLSKMAWGLNLPVETLTGQTIALYNSMSALSKDRVYGFTDMRGEKLQAAVQQLMGALESISPRRIMALTQTPGGTWGQALERTIKDPMASLNAAVGRAMSKMGTGILETGNLGKLRAESFVRLSMGLGLQGNEKELYSAGVEIAKAYKAGALDPNTIKTMQGRIVDARFDQAKSVGQNIAQGSDVMQVIAGTLMNLLRVVVEMANHVKIFGGVSATARGLETEFREQRNYGDSVARGTRRVVRT